LSRVINQPAHLLRVQAGGASSGRGRTENARNAVRGLMTVSEAGPQRDQHARADVVAERDGAEQVNPADTEPLADRERGGHHVTARMPAARP
jgi:hypothetical protein